MSIHELPESLDIARYRTLLTALGLLLTLAVLAYAMYAFVPVGVDWHLTYYPVGRAYLSGQTRLWETDFYYAPGAWYNPPWLLPILLPFTALPEREGSLAFRLATIVVLACSAIVFTEGQRWRRACLALVMASLPVWDSLIIGNVDGIVLLGLLLGYLATERRNPWLLGVGLVLASVKPQLSVLPTIALLPSLRGWQRGQLFTASIAPAAAIASSLAIAGLDWPLRLLKVMQENPPIPQFNFSLHRALNQARSTLDLPSWLPYLVGAVLFAWLI